jgi:hypothetical protein
LEVVSLVEDSNRFNTNDQAASWRGAIGMHPLGAAADTMTYLSPSFRIRAHSLALFLLIFAGRALAQAGPPFRTDDPETPGNKHWEINLGWIGDRNPAAGAYQVPDFDFNYGLGDRIQLKYELPIAIEENRVPPADIVAQPAQSGTVLAGLGESLLGVKYRFYEHHPGDPWIGRTPSLVAKAPTVSGEAEEPVVDFSVGIYPQLSLNNPTSSVRRGVVASGPNFLLPVEANARLGPIRLDGEVGYNFGNQSLPQSWIRGMIAGHEFTDRTEAYVEIYDQQDANRLPPGRGVGQFATGQPKQRQTTLGLGGRQALNKQKSLILLLMGGTSFQAVSVNNSQPTWIAYVGLQVLLGPKEPISSQVEQKLPNEGSK